MHGGVLIIFVNDTLSEHLNAIHIPMHGPQGVCRLCVHRVRNRLGGMGGNQFNWLLFPIGLGRSWHELSDMKALCFLLEK